jgi:RNA polymerase sigma factor (sigma-70 family)
VIAVIADASPPSQAGWNPDRLIAELYAREYRLLIRLAVLLLLDLRAAEEVVGDAFVAIHRGWRRPRDSEKALPYLRRAVVSKSRSVQRRRMAANGSTLKAEPGRRGSIGILESSAVVAALSGLPQRQREAIVLRYYASLSEAEVAAAMGVRKGMVESYIAGGMSSLRVVLGQESAIGGADSGRPV